MQQIKVTRKLSQRDVNYINSLNTGVLLVLENTKDQDSSAFSQFNQNVQIRIIGGLDETKKPKYNSSQYYERTIYTPVEAAGIMSEFEKIEEGVQDNWSDLEKAVYVYDKLASGIAYEEVITHKDLGRSLNIMNTKKGVCAGYALTYKEAMDRLGVECEYINKPHSHAWNAIKINGQYYPVDLTWDACNRHKTQSQGLWYFACDPSFSQDKSHQADHSDMQVPSNCLPPQEIINALRKVRGRDKGNKTWILNREDKTSCYMSKIGKTNEGLFVYAHSEIDSKNQPGEINVLFSELDLDSAKNLSKEQKSHIKNKLLSKERISKKLKEKAGYIGTSEFINNQYCKVNYSEKKIPRQTTYTRNDGTSFVLLPADKERKSGVLAYHLVEFDQDHKGKSHVIYSEDDLIKDVGPTLKSGIANVLLSKDRVEQKLKNVGGYVGYIRQHGNRSVQKYYDPEQEKRIANFTR